MFWLRLSSMSDRLDQLAVVSRRRLAPRRWWPGVFVCALVLTFGVLLAPGEAWAQLSGETLDSGAGSLTETSAPEAASGTPAPDPPPREAPTPASETPAPETSSGTGSSEPSPPPEPDGEAPASAPEQTPATPATHSTGEVLGPVAGSTDETVGPAVESVGGTGESAVKPVQRTTRPVRRTAGPTVETVRGNAEPVTKAVGGMVDPVHEAAGPMVGEAGRKAEPILEPVHQTIQPVADPARRAVAPVVQPVREVVDPVATPVRKAVEPKIKPVRRSVRPVIWPVHETAKPVIEPARRTAEPVIEPIHESVNPVTKPVHEAIEPVVGSNPGPVDGGGGAVDPDERSSAPKRNGSMRNLPTEDHPVTGGPAPTRTSVRDSEAASLATGRPPKDAIAQGGYGLPLPRIASRRTASQPALSPVPTRTEQSMLTPAASGEPVDSFSKPLAPGSRLADAIESSGFRVQLYAQLFEDAPSDGYVLAVGGYDGAGSVPEQMPSFPSGAVAATGGLSSGSSPGNGTGQAILALLSALVLAGKFSSICRDLPKPGSALRLAVERPG